LRSPVRVYWRLFPRPPGCKRLLVALAAVGLAGGGGREAIGPTHLVTSPRFRFEAPAPWPVSRSAKGVSVAPAGDATTLLAVYVLPLRTDFRPELWPQVVLELDGDAAALARGLGGTVEHRRSLEVAGMKARQYELAFRRGDADLRERITFALEGKREFELLCRWRADEGEPPECDLLAKSFTPV
jgi:hypothetical protein